MFQVCASINHRMDLTVPWIWLRGRCYAANLWLNPDQFTDTVSEDIKYMQKDSNPITYPKLNLRFANVKHTKIQGLVQYVSPAVARECEAAEVAVVHRQERGCEFPRIITGINAGPQHITLYDKEIEDVRPIRRITLSYFVVRNGYVLTLCYLIGLLRYNPYSKEEYWEYSGSGSEKIYRLTESGGLCFEGYYGMRVSTSQYIDPNLGPTAHMADEYSAAQHWLTTNDWKIARENPTSFERFTEGIAGPNDQNADSSAFLRSVRQGVLNLHNSTTLFSGIEIEAHRAQCTDRYLMSEMLSHLDEESFNGNGIAYGKDVSELKSSYNTTLDGIKSVFNGALPLARKKSIIAGLYLSFHYGWKLFAKDTGELAGAGWHKQSKKHLHAHGSFETKDGWNVAKGYSITYDPWPEANQDFKEAIAYLDLMPSPANLWDLVPFSFVVDWFLPIGKALETMEAYDNMIKYYHIYACTSTTKVTQPYQPPEGWIGHGEVTCFKRVISLTPVEPLTAKKTANLSTHMVEATALCSSLHG